MKAIADFLSPYRCLIDAHVVNFFKDKLWETVDAEWMNCLRKEPVENLLNIPSGAVKDHWPVSLQNFVRELRSLVIGREPESLDQMFPNLKVVPLGSVIAQGMNPKKKHEVEILAAVVSAIASNVGAQKVIDVGAGQGYLSQVLSFEYQLSVVAVDASSHHSSVTSTRAERIKKHYAARLRKYDCGNKYLNVPQTVTCQILSSSTLSALSTCNLQNDNPERTGKRHLVLEDLELFKTKENSSGFNNTSPLVLAGLHACRDLSVNLLRNFVECEHVKAVVCIGCCYNLLSEEESVSINSISGFPMSSGAKIYGITFGKNARDLACQSAERWRRFSKGSIIQNFYLHIFRAAFQMVIDKYHPEILFSRPSIGRQGKALRRHQISRDLDWPVDAGQNTKNHVVHRKELGDTGTRTMITNMKSIREDVLHKKQESKDHLFRNTSQQSTLCVQFGSCGRESEVDCAFEKSDYTLFKEYTVSALSRLGFDLTQDIDLLTAWREAQPFMDLVGPYWSLRAAFGPLLETYFQLDRLLFLQEQGSSLKLMMFPLFDPVLSPRNIAIIAKKSI